MSRADLDPLPADFFGTWAEWFPDAPPVGFLLREAEPDRWLRIHSLPGSRRYPASGPDHAELLRRHNAVATDLLGEGATCAVVLLDVCDPQRSSALGARAALTESELPRVGSLPPNLWGDDDGVFAEPVCLFGGSTVWRAGAFDAFIVAAADDRVSGLFAALQTGAVYAPYDGGADLFFPHELGARSGARALRGLAFRSPGRSVGLALSGGNLTSVAAVGASGIRLCAW